MTIEEICSLVERFIAEPESLSFDEVACKVFAFQFEHNLPYRRFCESIGVMPSNLGRFQEIPALITTAFKDFDLSGLPPESRTTVFHSSGTTAQNRSRHFHSDRTLRVYEKSLLHWFKPNVIPDLTHADFVILTPRLIESPHSSLVHMLETVTRHFTASAAEFCATVSSNESWSIRFEKVVAAAKGSVSKKVPTTICGTAFSFVHLCDFLSQHHLTLSFPYGSRVFETGGYKGRSRSIAKPELHRMISQRLSIPETHIIGEYGMSELSSQAYDRVPGSSAARLYQFPPWARASVVSPETGEEVANGETGLLRVIDLANVGSVMAIQTEDLARSHGEGFELLGRNVHAQPRGCSLMNVNS